MPTGAVFTWCEPNRHYSAHCTWYHRTCPWKVLLSRALVRQRLVNLIQHDMDEIRDTLGQLLRLGMHIIAHIIVCGICVVVPLLLRMFVRLGNGRLARLDNLRALPGLLAGWSGVKVGVTAAAVGIAPALALPALAALAQMMLRSVCSLCAPLKLMLFLLKPSSIAPATSSISVPVMTPSLCVVASCLSANLSSPDGMGLM